MSGWEEMPSMMAMEALKGVTLYLRQSDANTFQQSSIPGASDLFKDFTTTPKQI